MFQLIERGVELGLEIANMLNRLIMMTARERHIVGCGLSPELIRKVGGATRWARRARARRVRRVYVDGAEGAGSAALRAN